MKPNHCTLSFAKFRLQIAFSYFPGDPGRTSGPPERCYPPEPEEFELLKVHLEVKDAAGSWAKTNVDLQALDFIDEFDLYERVEAACMDWLEGEWEASQEREAESRAEAASEAQP